MIFWSNRLFIARMQKHEIHFGSYRCQGGSLKKWGLIRGAMLMQGMKSPDDRRVTITCYQSITITIIMFSQVCVLGRGRQLCRIIVLDINIVFRKKSNSLSRSTHNLSKICSFVHTRQNSFEEQLLLHVCDPSKPLHQTTHPSKLH